MPRNAPAATAAVTVTLVSFHFIDRNGDKFTSSYKTDAAVTAAQIEAAAAAYSTGTQALLYKISKTTEWAGTPVASSADVAASRDSVQDQIRVLMKTPDGLSQAAILPAPYEGLLADGSDNPDTADTRYTDWRDAVEAMLPNAYEPVTVRFVQRHETNKAVPAG